MRSLLVAFVYLLACAASFAENLPEKYYYDRLYEDGNLDITIAFGFFQKESSHLPVELVLQYFPDLKRTRALVNETEKSIRDNSSIILNKVSQGRGYRVLEGVMRRNGTTIRVRIKMIHPDRGVDSYRLKAAFEEALYWDDIIIYDGHSRHGLGFPDFDPLPTSGSETYRYNRLEDRWIGFDKKHFQRNKYQILLLNSCQSEKYYLKPLRKYVWEKEPENLALLLTTDVASGNDSPFAISSFIKGILGEKSKYQIIVDMDLASKYYYEYHQEDGHIRSLYSEDGFFSDKYRGQGPPSKPVFRKRRFVP